MINKIKTILAVVLILCTCLPLSRCEKKPFPATSPQGQMEVEKEKDVPDLNQNDMEDKYSYTIPIKEVKIDELESFIWILVFIWPLPFWFLRSRMKFKIKTVLFSLIEICLIGFSFYLIVVWSIYYGETLYGGYIALVCISGISAIFLYECVINIIEWRRKE